MKNIYKDRFEKCERVYFVTNASRSHEVFNVLSEALCAFGMKSHRADAETEIQDLGGGRYKIVQEAPTTGYWSQGYRCETIVHVYKRKGEHFLKLEESVRLRVADKSKDDGKIVLRCVRGNNATNPASLEARFIDWLRSKTTCEK